MPAVLQVSGEVAHQMGLVPLAWLTALRSAGRKPTRLWWGLATAFGISWLADWGSHITGTFPLGPIYVPLQTGLIVWLLVPHPWAGRFFAVLFVTAISAILRQEPGPDIVVHTVAWGGLVGLLCLQPGLGRLRLTLAVAFGLGLVAWWGYVLSPSWASWLVFQGVRGLSLGLFCWAALPAPVWRLARAH